MSESTPRGTMDYELSTAESARYTTDVGSSRRTVLLHIQFQHGSTSLELEPADARELAAELATIAGEVETDE